MTFTVVPEMQLLSCAIAGLPAMAVDAQRYAFLAFPIHSLARADDYLSQTQLIWANVSMDSLIALAYCVFFACYVWIAMRLRTIAEVRGHLWILFAFGAFTLACAATRVMEVVTIWWPIYWLSVVIKTVTAAASITTAILFTRAIPTALRASKKIFHELAINQQEKAKAVRAVMSRVEETEARLQAVLDSVVDSIILMDARGVIVSINPAVTRLFEYSVQQLIGRSVQLLFHHPPAAEPESELTDRLRRALKPEGISASGRVFPLEMSITEVSHSGQTLLVGLLRDITERNRSQEEVRKQAAMLHLAHDAILLRDADDRIVFWSDGAQRMYGWTAKEAAGRISRDLLQTEFTTPLPVIEGALTHKGDWEGELLQHTKDGAEVVVGARWSLQREEDGSTRATMEINRDISARKRAEEALRQSEQHFQLIVNGIPQLAFMAEPNGYIFWYNRRWYDFTGKTLEETQGWGWGSVHDLELLPIVLSRWEEALASGRPFHMEHPLRSAAGVLHTFLTRIVPLKNAEGQVTRWFGTHTDISERKQAEDALSLQAMELYQQAEQLLVSQQALEAQRFELANRTAQLELVNTELQAFTYTVSHELRAPLRQIVGFASILKEDFGPGLPATIEGTLQRIAAAARRAGFMVDGMLSLARLGRQALKVRYVDLNAVVQEVLPMLEVEWEGRNVEWRIARLPALRCDPILIGQVFQNLLGNAIKYSRRREHAVIEVDSYQEEGETPVIFVRDNGTGFNMDYAHRLFGMFQRLHEEADFEGSGVGLATVRRIVQKHGGTVWAESEPGMGSTFFFTVEEGEQSRRVVEPYARAT